MATDRTRAWSERPIGSEKRAFTDRVAVFASPDVVPRGYLHLADVYAQAASEEKRDDALYALKIEARKIGADALALVTQGDTTVPWNSAASGVGAGPPHMQGYHMTGSKDLYLIRAKAYYWVLDRAPEWPAPEADSSATSG
jgi:hypothetical protein